MMPAHPESEQLSALAGGELEAPDLERVRAHVAACDDCSTLVAALQATLADLRLLDEPPMDEQAAWAIRSAVAKERRLERRGKRWQWAAGAAAAAVVAVVAVVSVQGGGDARDGQSGGGSALSRSAEGDFSFAQSELNYDEGSLADVLSGVVEDGSGPVQGHTEVAPASTPGGTGGSADSGGAVGEPAPMNAAPYQFDKANVSEEERTRVRSCLDSIRSSTRTEVGVLHVIAARYKGEPVYIYFLEAPARNPKRIELWVLARERCDVRYFRQANLPPA